VPPRGALLAPLQVFHVISEEEAYDGYGSYSIGAHELTNVAAERRLQADQQSGGGQDDALESEPPVLTHASGVAAAAGQQGGEAALPTRRSLKGRRSGVDEGDCPDCAWSRGLQASSSGSRTPAALLRRVMLVLAAALPVLLLML
jgi:hypothetical protein